MFAECLTQGAVRTAQGSMSLNLITLPTKTWSDLILPTKIGEYDITADELLEGSSRGQKNSEAKEFISNTLKDGMMPSKEFFELAEAQGIRERTLRYAMKEMNVQTIKDGDKWYKALPAD